MKKLIAIILTLATLIGAFTVFADAATAATSASLTYQAYVSNIGWMSKVSQSMTAGTTGRSLSMEAIRINYTDIRGNSQIKYRCHVSQIGWQTWKNSGEVGGTTGRSLAMEAIQIQLVNGAQNNFDVFYRAHVSNIGWMDWMTNGEIAGTTGRSLPIEAIEIMILPKVNIKYRTHIQNIGWNSYSGNGSISGTTGQSLRLEGLQIEITGGMIEYDCHVSNLGWCGYTSSGNLGGTTGRSLAIEAVKIRLTKDFAKVYDIYYRMHVQDKGWMGYAMNGNPAGTTGGSLRAEAIQIYLVRKGTSFNKGGEAYSDESFNPVWPCASNNAYYVTCLYYYATGSRHGSKFGSSRAVDIAGGGDIVAVESGTVTTKGYDAGGFGNYVIITHNNGTQSLYAHMSSVSVGKGQTISKGAKIGVMGSTGNSSGTHLHFEFSNSDPIMDYYYSKYSGKIKFESNVYSNNNKYNSDKTICNLLTRDYYKSGSYYYHK